MIIENTGTMQWRNTDDPCSLPGLASSSQTSRLLMVDSDSKLMLDYAAGDAAAFEQLYERYKQPLYKFFRNSCGCEVRSAELFQDAWLRVIKARAGYSSKVPFKAWLFRIARNLTIDYYRQSGRLKETSLEDDVPAELLTDLTTAPEAFVSLNEQVDSLQHVLDTLPPVQREATLLHYIAGMTIKEIAELVDVKPETVKSRIRYATVKIRAQLQESQ